MDELDLRILAALQESFPLVDRPFRMLADDLGIEEEELIRRVSRLKGLGLIRRIGPILDLRRLGMIGVLVAM
ncbi:Lrp/AsnC family transcriptional regulator, partial [Methanothrix sp.]